MPEQSSILTSDQIQTFLRDQFSNLFPDMAQNDKEFDRRESLRQKAFELVCQFYETSDSNSEKTREIAQNLGRIMELSTLLDIGEQGTIPPQIITIYPLRGAVGLKPNPDSSPLMQFCREFNVKHIEIPIGIQRSEQNKTQAELYLSPRSFNENPQDSFVRIVDFGIATGGTMELLINELTQNGFPAEQIHIQGAVGTLMAQYRLLKKYTEINLEWSVTGHMDAELPEHNPDADDLYYIKRLKQPDSSTFIEVSPTDWGDKIFKSTPEWNEEDLETFLSQLREQFPDLTDQEIYQLRIHYLSKMPISS